MGLKLNHGTVILVITAIPILMEAMDTDTHTLTTTLERDLLMPNQKPNHGITVAVMEVITAVVTTGDKSSSIYAKINFILVKPFGKMSSLHLSSIGIKNFLFSNIKNISK